MTLKQIRNFAKCAAALIAIPLVVCASPARAASRDEKSGNPPHSYSFISITTDRFGDADRAGILKILEGVTNDVYKKTGIRIVYKDPGGTDMVTNFIKEKPDFALIGMEDVMTLQMKKMNLEPMLLASVLGQQGINICVYTTGDYKDLKSLRGATINLYGGGNYNAAHIGLRKMLLEEGIDMPIDDFFGGIYKIPFEGSNFQALLLGKVNAVIEANWNFELFGKKLPQANMIKTGRCSEIYPAIGIFAKKGMDKDDAAKLKAYMKNIHKTAVLKELRTLVIALKIKFVEPDPAIIERVYSLYKEADQKGWLKEASELSLKMDRLPNGQILVKNKSYSGCKKTCKGAKNMEACMDRCMGE